MVLIDQWRSLRSFYSKYSTLAVACSSVKGCTYLARRYFFYHGKFAWQKKAIPHFTSTIHVAAQGRVNLIGEHTDYNESLMFIPMAIPMATVMIPKVQDDDEGVSHEHSVRVHQ